MVFNCLGVSGRVRDIFKGDDLEGVCDMFSGYVGRMWGVGLRNVSL